MGKKISYEQVKQDFERKNYNLISTEYVGIKSKLDYICNKHKDLGVQNVTYENFKAHENNCVKCRSEKKRNYLRKIDKHYNEIFIKYKNKVFDKVGNEYTLNQIVSKNEKIHLDLKHNICGNEFIIEQNKFLNKNCRCKNPSCPNKQENGNLMTFDMVKEQIYNICGDEYTISGKYYGHDQKITFTHNVCGNSFNMRINGFVYGGHRCPICARMSRLKKITKTQQQFEMEVNKAYKNEYKVVGQYINSNTPVLIKHEVCGCIFNVRAGRISNGTAQCPMCFYPSKGEEKINDFLKQNNIEFTRQKKFSNLYGTGNGLLSYDFYLPKYNLLIEYQGEQHECSVEIFGGDEQFKKQQEHDRRKRDYAKEHNINLLEIWYYDFDNVENIMCDYLENLLSKTA